MISCPVCNRELPKTVFNTGGIVPCPMCMEKIQVEAFPALFMERPKSNSGEILLSDREAGCFYHPEKRVEVHCDVCGRFLCALCDMDFGDRHICPACLETGKNKRKIADLEDSRARYDHTALFLAIAPMLFLFATIITAPMAVYIVIRYWSAPLRIVPHTRIRFIAAICIAGLQITGWGITFFNMLS